MIASKGTNELILAVVLLTASIVAFYRTVEKVSADTIIAQHEPSSSSPVVAIGSAPSSHDPRLDQPIAPNNPSQGHLLRPRTFQFKGYQVKELATFQATALLISKRAYSTSTNEHLDAVAPYDFAISWGAMSTPNVLKNFSYYQKNRFLYYANYVSFSETARQLQVDTLLANIHIIPANDNIARALDKIQPHDVVTLQGNLVEIFYNDQSMWRSSLSRTDTGDGACELLYLTRLEWYSQPPGSELIPLPKDYSR